MKTVDSTTAITERMELAASIAFQKPTIAVGAVQDFINVLSDTSHFLNAEQQRYAGSSYDPNTKLVAFTKKVIRDVLFYPDCYETAFRSLLDLHLATNEKNLFRDTFSFIHPTFLHQNSIQVQQFFVEKCKLILPGADNRPAIFLMDCLKNLLELRFETSKWDIVKRNSFSLQTYYLPKHNFIEKLRLTIIDTLINCYRQQHDPAIRFEALHLVLDIPREIAANKGSASHYESDAEVEKVLGFIAAEADNIPTAFRKEVLDELHWYKKQRVNPKFFPTLDALKEQLKPKTLTQEVIQYLLVLEQEYVRSVEKTKYERDFKKLMLQYTPEDMANTLEELWSSSKSPYWYFSHPVEMVCDYDIKYTKAVYLQLKKKSRAFIHYYGFAFLQRFRCADGMLEFFQSEVFGYLETGSESDLKIVLEVYSAHFANKIVLNPYDKDIIATVFSRRKDGLGVTMSSTLVLCYKHTPETALPYIKDFLDDCDQKSASHLYWRLEDEISSNRQLSALLLGASVRFDIDHNIEKVLTLIGKDSTPEAMFGNFLQRYERKRLLQKTARDAYSLVPNGERDFFSEGRDDEYRLLLYQLGLQWFIHVKGDRFEESYAEDLLDYLRPGLEFTLPCAVLYIETGMKERSNYFTLFRLIESLRIFHTKTPILIDTLGFLLRVAGKAYAGQKTFLQDIYFISNQVLACVGCKHGTAGQPCESDVHLRELFLEEQLHYSEDVIMKDLIESALRTVEEDIRRQTDDEKTDW